MKKKENPLPTLKPFQYEARIEATIALVEAYAQPGFREGMREKYGQENAQKVLEGIIDIGTSLITFTATAEASTLNGKEIRLERVLWLESRKLYPSLSSPKRKHFLYRFQGAAGEIYEWVSHPNTTKREVGREYRVSFRVIGSRIERSGKEVKRIFHPLFRDTSKKRK